MIVPERSFVLPYLCFQSCHGFRLALARALTVNAQRGLLSRSPPANSVQPMQEPLGFSSCLLDFISAIFSPPTTAHRSAGAKGRWRRRSYAIRSPRLFRAEAPRLKVM